MRELLHDLFLELGLIDIANGVLNANHKFKIKIYAQIFKHHINKRDLIVTKSRAYTMKKLFEKELEKFYESENA